MGDEVRGVSEAPALSGSAVGSIGVYLARQRRLRGISLEDLANLTKIPLRSIERLESGAFDGHSDGFSRGFVRTIATALGLDSEDAIMRMLGEPADSGDEARSQRARNYRLLAIGAAVPAAIGVLVLGGWLWGRIAAATGSDAAEIVYRRDAVRALALERVQPPRATGEVAERAGVGDPAN